MKEKYMKSLGERSCVPHICGKAAAMQAFKTECVFTLCPFQNDVKPKVKRHA